MSVDFCCCCWFFLIFGVYVRVRCLRFQYYYFFYLFVFSFRIFKFDQLDFWMNAKYFTHFTSNKYMCFCFVYVYFFGHFFIRLSQQLFQFDSPSKNDSIDFLFRFFFILKMMKFQRYNSHGIYLIRFFILFKLRFWLTLEYVENGNHRIIIISRVLLAQLTPLKKPPYFRSNRKFRRGVLFQY